MVKLAIGPAGQFFYQSVVVSWILIVYDMQESRHKEHDNESARLCFAIACYQVLLRSQNLRWRTR